MIDGFVRRRRWGADPAGDPADNAGGFRFRIWAPAAGALRLALADRGEDLPMDEAGDGWFEIVTDRVAPGDAYGFRLPDGLVVPDPAARAQRGDVHGPSVLVDPRAYRWKTASWTGRPWEEAVIYELHTGTFTPDGTFDGVAAKLDHLAETGVTALELMPVAQFGGDRGWGYDGVLQYAPHRAYGGPDRLKALVDAAHERGLMVLLDVVYNHFGPDGNYLHLYAPDFFDAARQTPWGAAIAYDRPAVRDFFVENALYWLEEYRIDGLRLDAINEIHDPSPEHILDTIAATVRARLPDRQIHLTTEDDRNITRLHERDAEGGVRAYTAEWNDDFHHAAHVIATGEPEGYYIDYARGAVAGLARALAEGYAFQGEPSAFWDGAPRGEPSAHLPPTAFVNFLQNHDQIGNRAFGERLSDLAPPDAIEALTAILLLSPQIPLLFMGEEWGETGMFAFFTDFHGELADAVRKGRRLEFRRFVRFADDANRERIPDPNAESTFLASRPGWDNMDAPAGRKRHALVARLLAIRHREIVPRLRGMGGHAGEARTGDRGAIGVRWTLGDGSELMLLANPGDDADAAPMAPRGRTIYESAPGIGAAAAGELPAWSAVAFLADAPGATGAADAADAPDTTGAGDPS